MTKGAPDGVPFVEGVTLSLLCDLVPPRIMTHVSVNGRIDCRIGKRFVLGFRV